MEFRQKKIRGIDLFDFTSFFGLDFLKFSGPLWGANKEPTRPFLSKKGLFSLKKCLQSRRIKNDKLFISKT